MKLGVFRTKNMKQKIVIFATLFEKSILTQMVKN